MKKEELPRLRSIHSDFLIHWTGKDIDQEFDKKWFENPGSKTNDNIVIERYIERLKDILKYGLWMTKHPEDKAIHVNNQEEISRPWPARTCFTELRISEARSHAIEYGRLGIGFKRFFVINRMGHPMVYYPSDRLTWFMPPCVKDHDSNQHVFTCFLKPMYTRKGDGGEALLDYQYYDESEWRIIYSEEIETFLQKNNKVVFDKNIVKPEKAFPEYNEKIKYNQYKPHYLIPLDSWFSMIIYPSIKIKNKAQKDPEVLKLIKEIKKRPGAISIEKDNWPIEIDLDACRNF